MELETVRVGKHALAGGHELREFDVGRTQALERLAQAHGRAVRLAPEAIEADLQQRAQQDVDRVPEAPDGPR
ncbi:MAG TPA: hypothetical protein VMF89_11745, partial [Polyangiales bacterium]|nr:hypothetical protein [Polyangiales bacterium]